ncbi:MAG: GGDEF domain-containing protein [Anaerolineaceae bacterium]
MNKPPALNALFSSSTDEREFGSVETSPILRIIRPTALAVWVLVFCVQAQTVVTTGSSRNWMVMVLSTALFAGVHAQFWYEESEQGRRFHRAMERMRGRIYEDDDTGLPNSRHFVFELRRQMMRSVRSGRGFSLVLTDIGGFEKARGFEGKIISSMTKTFRHSLTEGDFIAHLQGPIYAGIVLDDGDHSAADKADNLLWAIGSCIPLELAGDVFPVVSLSGYEGELEVRDFLRRAQRDLISSRSKGITARPPMRRAPSELAA